MTTAAKLVSAPAATPPYDIVRAAYAELHVTDLAASERFYVDLLGMIVAERTARHALPARLGGAIATTRSCCVRRRSRLPRAWASGCAARRTSTSSRRISRRSGLATEWAHGPEPGVGRALRVWDPLGYPLEFFHQMEQAETQLQRFDLHRGAPILRLDHLNLHTPRIEDAFRFWTGLGFRCSEYISTDGPDERITGAWLLRKPTVHDVALTAGRGPRLHHTAFWIGEPAGVLRACDQLAAGGHAEVIERGPGRHGVSNAFFVYLRDPDGHRIELYSCDYYTGDPDLKPLRWSVNDVRCRSFWGTRAPDSWYDESSSILGPDGEIVPTEDATSTSATSTPRSWSSARAGDPGESLMPLPDGLTPTKVVGVHLNYRSRAEQRGRVPTEPSYFLKPPSSISDGGPVVRPQGTELLASEGEIAVIIGTLACAMQPSSDAAARDRLVRAGERLRRPRLPLGRSRLERPHEGPGRLHADRPCLGRHRRRPRVAAADDARERRGRPAGARLTT